MKLPEEAYAVALASMPNVGPATLHRWLNGVTPSTAWRRVRTGPETAVAQAWELHSRRGITALLPDHPQYPSRLSGDPRAPAVLFCLGNPAALRNAPTVALVGTRAPTRYGLGVAAQLGAELTAAGVSVISGLALGIDGAAHEAACACEPGAPPIGVVAGGLDNPYPSRHARLWERVAERGAVVSESPAGVRTEKWRFPVRNRLLAAMSDVVVVIESRHGGGAQHTVNAALDQSKPVGAVPGSIRSATSEGTNAMLADGAFPVCSAADVLLALSLEAASVPVRRAVTSPERPRDLGEEQRVYDALSQDPISLEQLLRETGLDIAELCARLERLVQLGAATDLGGWWQRT